MKDDRKIHHAIRFAGSDKAPPKTFKSDDEVDELAASLGPEELQRLFDAGDISGTWKGLKAEEPKAASKSAKK